MSPNIENVTNRRNLIKGLTAAGGVAATGIWTKPVVELPVHAETSTDEKFSGDVVSALP